MTPDQILALLRLQADLYLQVTQQQAAIGQLQAELARLTTPDVPAE